MATRKPSPVLLAHAYRFRDVVACYAATSQGGTLYISEQDARKYAAALLAAADSIARESFTQSNVPQFALYEGEES